MQAKQQENVDRILETIIALLSKMEVPFDQFGKVHEAISFCHALREQNKLEQEQDKKKAPSRGKK